MVGLREGTENILTIQYHFKGKSNPRSQSLTLIIKDNKVNRTQDSIHSLATIGCTLNLRRI